MTWLVKILYYLGLCALFPTLGGLLHLLMMETGGPHEPMESASTWSVVLLVLVIAGIVASTGLAVFRRERRRSLAGTLLLLLLLPATLYGAEFLFRNSVPKWPMNGLHGVSAEMGQRSWAHSIGKGGIQSNDWGQRDLNRSENPIPGVYRIAFVGDSFLEESSTVPVSLRVEQMIDSPNVEVINLGVSATGPDEYYYRTRNVAIPMGIDHCVVFVFAGNDFASPERTLTSSAGIVAVFPRGSFFSSVGLTAINHLLTNHKRPVLQAWFSSGNLLQRELSLKRFIESANDSEIRDLLYSLDHQNLTPFQREVLAGRLNDSDMLPFYQMLRKPDKGLFRSYYLSAGLWSASVGGGEWAALSENSCYHWLSKTHALCREKGIAFTLVVIPEAFQVDPRMVEQWRPLTDMRRLTRCCRSASDRLLDRVQRDNMPCIDLHESLDGKRGTYLNLDGHWSDLGVEVVADLLATRLSKISRHSAARETSNRK